MTHEHTGVPLYDIQSSSFARISRRAKITILIISWRPGELSHNAQRTFRVEVLS